MKKLLISGVLSCSLLLSGLFGGQKTEAATFGNKVTNIALNYIGVPYRWGGTSPNGFDCSGFTSYTYKQAGMTLPRTTADQYAKGQPVSKWNLQEGDLVFFSTYKAGASHVGISLGGDKFVHASSSKGVTVSSLSESYYTNTYIGSKRVTNDSFRWALTDGKWYYYKNDVMQTGWVKDRGTWYYLASDGKMQTGWIKDGGTWYYLNSSGTMEIGWVYTGGAWYYLKSDGAMATGWVYTSGHWYYLKSSGAMATGWVLAGNKWYYLQGSGAMAANTTIDGYKLGKDGAWIK